MIPIMFMGFDMSGGLPLLVVHEFRAGRDGIEHYTDAVLRATIQPENFAEYARGYERMYPGLIRAFGGSQEDEGE